MPVGIAVDGTQLYWANLGVSGSGTIARASVAGGTMPSLVASSQVGLLGLVVRDGNIAWSLTRGQSTTAIRLLVESASASVDVASTESSTLTMTTDPMRLYWTGVGGIRTTPFSANAPTTLAGTNQLAPQSGIALRDGWLYYTMGDTVAKIPVTGGSPTVLATGQSNPMSPAVDDEWVSFIAGNDIMRVPVAGGPPVVVASGEASPKQLAVDTAGAYWLNTPGTNSTDNAIVFSSRTESTRLVLVSGLRDPRGFALGAQYVYWLERGMGGSDGAVLRTAK